MKSGLLTSNLSWLESELQNWNCCGGQWNLHGKSKYSSLKSSKDTALRWNRQFNKITVKCQLNSKQTKQQRSKHSKLQPASRDAMSRRHTRSSAHGSIRLQNNDLPTIIIVTYPLETNDLPSTAMTYPARKVNGDVGCWADVGMLKLRCTPTAASK